VVASNTVEATLESGELDVAVSAGRELITRLRGTTYSYHLAVLLGIITAALVAHDDLEESLSTALEACPLLRDHGLLFGSSIILRCALRLSDG
jgi:hypothetical protein